MKSVKFDPVAACYFGILIIAVIVVFIFLSPKMDNNLPKSGRSLIFASLALLEPHIPSKEELYERVKEAEQEERDRLYDENDPRRNPNFASIT